MDVSTGGLVLISGSACTLGCRYCPQRRSERRSIGSGALVAALNLLEPAPDAPVEVTFTGGEPLLELDLVREAAARLEERFGSDRLRLTLLTNGTLLDDATLGFLAEHRFRVQISIDGGPAAQELRAPGSSAATSELLERLRHPDLLRERVRTAMVCTSANLGILAESVEWLVQHGVREIWCGPVLTHDPGWHAGLESVLEEQLERVAELCRRWVARGRPAPFAPFRRTRAEEPVRDPDAPVCRAASPDSLAVGPDGAAAGCSALLDLQTSAARSFVERDLAPVQPGRIDDPGFTEALAAFPERMAAADFPPRPRERWSGRRRCADCTHLGVCRVCPVAAGAVPGNADPRRVPDLACAFMDAVLTRRREVSPLPSAADLLRGAGELPSERRAVAAALGL